MLAVSATSLLLEERDEQSNTLVLADVYQKSSHLAHLPGNTDAKLRTPNMNPTFYKRGKGKLTESLRRNIVNKLFSLYFLFFECLIFRLSAVDSSINK